MKKLISASIHLLSCKQLLLTLCALLSLVSSPTLANNYERDKPVPVAKVLFGHVISVRNITEEELIQDKNDGWKTFGGALIGGVIGNQFGSGSGRDITTVLGAIIGGSVASNQQNNRHVKITYLVELIIEVNGPIYDAKGAKKASEQFMIIQDYDSNMVFHKSEDVRMVHLANGRVRIDKQM